MQLDPELPQGHAQLGWILAFKRQHEASLAAFEQALALNRNYHGHQFGLALIYAGQPERALDVLREGMRLDPFGSAARYAFLGNASYMLHRYSEALPYLRQCVTRRPNLRIGHLWLAATAAQLGLSEEARCAADEVRRLEPSFTIDRWKVTAPYKRPEDGKHLFEGIRKAGLPDS